MDLAELPAVVPVAEVLRAAAEPLPSLDDPAFGTVFDRFAQARIVLLGEASHGTSEFYRARAAVTRRLEIIQHLMRHHRSNASDSLDDSFGDKAI